MFYTVPFFLFFRGFLCVLCLKWSLYLLSNLFIACLLFFPSVLIHSIINLTLYVACLAHLLTVLLIVLVFIVIKFSNLAAVVFLFPLPHLDKIEIYCLVRPVLVTFTVPKDQLLPWLSSFTALLPFPCHGLLHSLSLIDQSSFVNKFLLLMLSKCNPFEFVLFFFNFLGTQANAKIDFY